MASTKIHRICSKCLRDNLSGLSFVRRSHPVVTWFGYDDCCNDCAWQLKDEVPYKRNQGIGVRIQPMNRMRGGIARNTGEGGGRF